MSIENEEDLLLEEEFCPICYEPNLDFETECCKNKFHKHCLKLWKKKVLHVPCAVLVVLKNLKANTI